MLFVMHCSTLCYITLITPWLQPSSLQKREHCRIVLYLRNGVSTGKGGIYFSRSGPVRHRYCGITRFGCQCEFTLPLAYFCDVSLRFLCFAPPTPPRLPLHICLFPLNYLVAFSLQVSYYMFIHIKKKFNRGGKEKKKSRQPPCVFLGQVQNEIQ